jgi:hypothetical protein
MENKEKVSGGYDIVSQSHKDFWLDPNNFSLLSKTNPTFLIPPTHEKVRKSPTKVSPSTPTQ